ncbi:HNH endonuclease [Enterococcus thailandicus]|uniref:HNH endonuclease n=1 Tax=Enterococcus thailandicus TaxID=417368 RepID=UPI0022E1704F|nr:HNH endonuclease [Enterococcus thailandicus]
MAKGKYEEWLTEDGLLKLEGWAHDGLTDEQIAEKIGIRRPTLYDWKKKYSDISDALKRGKEVVDRQVENALLKRALGYEYTEVTKERIIDTGQKKRHNGESKLTEKDWDIALAYFDNKCAYCSKSGEMTKDHLDPLKNGGELAFYNVVPACQSCNSSKKDHQWLAWYQSQDFYDPGRAKRITEYIQFTLAFPKDDDSNQMGKLVITKEVTKQVAPDTTAQIFWLKNRKPEEWRDKKETEITGSLNVASTAKEIETFFSGSDSS